MGKGKVVVEEGDKDMGKTQTVEESEGEREEYVGVPKEEKRMVMVEGEGEGGVEKGSGEDEDGVGGRRSHSGILKLSKLHSMISDSKGCQGEPQVSSELSETLHKAFRKKYYHQ